MACDEDEPHFFSLSLEDGTERWMRPIPTPSAASAVADPRGGVWVFSTSETPDQRSALQTPELRFSVKFGAGLRDWSAAQLPIVVTPQGEARIVFPRFGGGVVAIGD